VGVRTATSGDAVLIKRKKAPGYVASEPSVRVIKKKRYVTYRQLGRVKIEVPRAIPGACQAAPITGRRRSPALTNAVEKREIVVIPLITWVIRRDRVQVLT
jgi:hypothetical protein